MAEDNYKIAPIPERIQKNIGVLILTADKTEDLEFFYPYYRLSEAGYDVTVATPKGGEFKGKAGLGLKQTVPVETIAVEQFALLYIPGGKAPLELRENEAVRKLVKDFVALGKPIAAICHGAQVLVSADVIRGRKIAAWPEVKSEIEAAGGTYVDGALVEDGQFITARKPGDLHRHLSGCLDYLEGRVSKFNTATKKAS